MPEDAAIVVQQFVQALDRDDFEVARMYLADGCVYEGRSETLAEADAIIRSYREASEWGRSNLDELQFSSEVRMESDDVYVVRYIDHITHAGRRHIYCCEQVLSIGGQGNITRIQHKELPGEREALLEFFGSVGVSR